MFSGDNKSKYKSINFNPGDKAGVDDLELLYFLKGFTEESIKPNNSFISQEDALKIIETDSFQNLYDFLHSKKETIIAKEYSELTKTERDYYNILFALTCIYAQAEGNFFLVDNNGNKFAAHKTIKPYKSKQPAIAIIATGPEENHEVSAFAAALNGEAITSYLKEIIAGHGNLGKEDDKYFVKNARKLVVDMNEILKQPSKVNYHPLENEGKLYLQKKLNFDDIKQKKSYISIKREISRNMIDRNKACGIYEGNKRLFNKLYREFNNLCEFHAQHLNPDTWKFDGEDKEKHGPKAISCSKIVVYMNYVKYHAKYGASVLGNKDIEEIEDGHPPIFERTYRGNFNELTTDKLLAFMVSNQQFLTLHSSDYNLKAVGDILDKAKNIMPEHLDKINLLENIFFVNQKRNTIGR